MIHKDDCTIFNAIGGQCNCGADSRWCARHRCETVESICPDCVAEDHAGREAMELVTEQPLPTRRDDLPGMQDLVLQDIERRKAIGIERYGQLLKPFDGRDALRDAYEEAMDLVVYLRKIIYERDGR